MSRRVEIEELYNIKDKTHLFLITNLTTGGTKRVEFIYNKSMNYLYDIADDGRGCTIKELKIAENKGYDFYVEIEEPVEYKELTVEEQIEEEFGYLFN